MPICDPGLVRHGPVSESPGATCIWFPAGDKATLMRSGANGRYFGVRFRPEGAIAAGVDAADLTADGFAPALDILIDSNPAQQTFALRGAGLYLCADPAGGISLSRLHQGPWEQFHADL